MKVSLKQLQTHTHSNWLNFSWMQLLYVFFLCSWCHTIFWIELNGRHISEISLKEDAFLTACPLQHLSSFPFQARVPKCHLYIQWHFCFPSSTSLSHQNWHSTIETLQGFGRLSCYSPWGCLSALSWHSISTAVDRTSYSPSSKYTFFLASGAMQPLGFLLPSSWSASFSFNQSQTASYQ